MRITCHSQLTSFLPSGANGFVCYQSEYHYYSRKRDKKHFRIINLHSAITFVIIEILRQFKWLLWISGKKIAYLFTEKKTDWPCSLVSGKDQIQWTFTILSTYFYRLSASSTNRERSILFHSQPIHWVANTLLSWPMIVSELYKRVYCIVYVCSGFQEIPGDKMSLCLTITIYIGNAWPTGSVMAVIGGAVTQGLRGSSTINQVRK